MYPVTWHQQQGSCQGTTKSSFIHVTPLRCRRNIRNQPQRIDPKWSNYKRNGWTKLLVCNNYLFQRKHTARHQALAEHFNYSQTLRLPSEASLNKSPDTKHDNTQLHDFKRIATIVALRPRRCLDTFTTSHRTTLLRLLLQSDIVNQSQAKLFIVTDTQCETINQQTRSAD